MKEAHESGLSFDKYSAYLILAKYDENITTDDCKTMTMREIRDLISKYEGNSEHSSKGNGNGSNCNDNSSLASTKSSGKHNGKGNKNRCDK